MSEQLLRLLFLPGKVHDDFTVSPPCVAEMVSENGLEHVAIYHAITGTPFQRHSRCQRSETLEMWERLTGERLTPALEPVATERREA